MVVVVRVPLCPPPALKAELDAAGLQPDDCILIESDRRPRIVRDVAWDVVSLAGQLEILHVEHDRPTDQLGEHLGPRRHLSIL